ncbi:MAG: hypothetical protein VYA34_02560 [Myxococcota bacterium]|nr:hypothetical protein [Myxococcota bacterium]
MLEITYRFKLSNEQVREYKVFLDDAGNYIEPAAECDYPDWVRLEVDQCRECPLKPKDHYFCPAAKGLYRLMTEFAEVVSFVPISVVIMTANRTISAEVPAQSALTSVMGLVMASSGCPVVGKLRPMARFHLPFADKTETLYRAMGMYLTSQFLRQRRGLTPDWSLQGLEKIYGEIHAVNRDFSERLRNGPGKETTLGGLTLLDTFAQYGGSLAKFMPERLESLFRMYFDEEDD